MEIIYYPEYTDDDPYGPIGKFSKKLEKKRPDLWILMKQTLKKAKTPEGLKNLEKIKWVEPLKKVKAPIYEFRIPPTKRGGVVRLYFCYAKNDKDKIIILAAELKKSSGADLDKIDQAVLRYREICK